MRILVIRTGNSLDLTGRTESNYGGSRDAVGTCRALAARGHQVAIAGSIRDGEVPGVDSISWSVARGCNDMAKMSLADKDSAEADCDEFVARVDAWAPDVVLTSVGATPTRVSLREDVGTLIFAVKYCLAELWLRRARPQWPRVCMTNDPRSIPQEWEIWNWENCRPAAVLSQRDLDWQRRVHGVQTRVVEKYAALENLFSYGEPLRAPRPDASWDVTALAHGHFQDHRVRPKKRIEVWKWILRYFHACPECGLPRYPYEGDCPAALAGSYCERECPGFMFLEWRVIGRHWERFPWYDMRHMPGPCESHEVPDVLNDSVCGPIIPVLHGYLTAKLRQYVMNGCVPLLYGRDPECLLAYDPDQRYVRYDEWPRFADAEELVAKAEELTHKGGMAARQHWVTELCERTRPSVDLVEQCCEWFADGGEPDLVRWGGYEPANA